MKLLLLMLMLFGIGCACDRPTPSSPPSGVTSHDVAVAVSFACIDSTDEATIELAEKMFNKCVEKNLDEDDDFDEPNCMYFVCNVMRRAVGRPECRPQHYMDQFK